MFNTEPSPTYMWTVKTKKTDLPGETLESSYCSLLIKVIFERKFSKIRQSMREQ
jgi:hypothetical protein